MFSVLDSLIPELRVEDVDPESPPVVLSLFPKAVIVDCKTLKPDHLLKVASWILFPKNHVITTTVECLHAKSRQNVITMLLSAMTISSEQADEIVRSPDQKTIQEFSAEAKFFGIHTELLKICTPKEQLRTIEQALCDIGERGMHEVHVVSTNAVVIGKDYYSCISPTKIPQLYIWSDTNWLFHNIPTGRRSTDTCRPRKATTFGKISEMDKLLALPASLRTPLVTPASLRSDPRTSLK